jgi:hypothetical protein
MTRTLTRLEASSHLRLHLDLPPLEGSARADKKSAEGSCPTVRAKWVARGDFALCSPLCARRLHA